jgi:hypothetical protein
MRMPVSLEFCTWIETRGLEPLHVTAIRTPIADRRPCSLPHRRPSSASTQILTLRSHDTRPTCHQYYNSSGSNIPRLYYCPQSLRRPTTLASYKPAATQPTDCATARIRHSNVLPPQLDPDPILSVCSPRPYSALEEQDTNRIQPTNKRLPHLSAALSLLNILPQPAMRVLLAAPPHSRHRALRLPESVV